MKSQQQHHAIYECLAELSERYCLPAPVDFVPSGEDIFRSPKEPDSVVAELTKKFPADELLASGIIVNDGDRNRQLNPKLSEGFVLLRDRATDNVYDVLTEQGCLTSGLPVLEVLGDKQTRAALTNSEFLCVCFAFEDLAYLRALGLPATVGFGMENMSPPALEAFCRAFEIELGHLLEDKDDESSHVDPSGSCSAGPVRKSEACPDDGEPVADRQSVLDRAMQSKAAAGCQVALVEWSPASMSLEPSPSVAVLRSFLDDVYTHLSVNTRMIQSWSPNHKDLERINFALKRQAVPWLCRVVSRDLEDNVTTLDRSGDSGRQEVRVPPKDYVEALSQLQQNHRGNNSRLLSPDRREQVWRDFEDKLEHDVINPMRNSALASWDPMEKVLRLMFAELSGDLLSKLAVSNIKLSDSLEETRTRCGELAAPEQVKQLAMSVDTMLKVAQEIQRCNETTIIATAVPAALTVKKTLPSQALDSPTNSNS